MHSDPLNFLKDVDVRLSVELGGALMPLRDVMALREDSVVPLDRLTDELVDIAVNGRRIARGEVVVVRGARRRRRRRRRRGAHGLREHEHSRRLLRELHGHTGFGRALRGGRGARVCDGVLTVALLLLGLGHLLLQLGVRRPRRGEVQV